MALQIYNTFSREKELFEPLNGPKVGIYTCGPTVYNYAHIGNLRSYIFADILHRVLAYDGYKVTQVMNITDVGHLTSDADEGEDKMETGARREGKSVWDLAEFYTDAFKRDMAQLNINEPNIWCKATAHIKEQIEQVKQLIENGYTYTTSDGIYFDTSKLDDYGKLARLQKENLEGGKRVDLGEKKNKTDFALWKFSPKEGAQRQMEWWFNGPMAGELVDDITKDSEHAATIGFPGWHIECSAMSTKYLGFQFDIHTGGIDHIQVHHTNEIAQAECAYGLKPWVKYWLHGEFLVIDKGKMAKSGGNFLTLAILTEKFDALAYRYLCLSGHYRQQIAFSDEAMATAQASYIRLKNIIANLQEQKDAKMDAKDVLEYKEQFQAAIDDDLNMPQALAVLWSMLRDPEVHPKEKLGMADDFDDVLGLKLMDDQNVSIPFAVQKLIDAREVSRKDKDWKKADELRDAITKAGFNISDQKGGYRIKKL